ncbi:MAG TPA: hypothetical protein VNG71_09350 [Pyrinomonadaceae bacterium]|nr:hypothetical protein [Pyrinomonadaceae bacterium]
MISRTVQFVIPPLIVLGAIVFIAQLGSPQQAPFGKHNQAKIDEGRFPIVDYSAPDSIDVNELARRKKRSAKFDNSDWSINPKAVSDTTVRVDFVDRSLPAFPISQSTAIIIGTVSAAHAHLSNDKSGVYSAFTAEVNEVLVNRSQSPIVIGRLIEVEREGGRVKFPSGRVHIYMTNEQGMPQVGSRYVLFLSGGEDEGVFQIVTGYELSAGKVHALDELKGPKLYEMFDEVTFLSELRAKILNL